MRSHVIRDPRTIAFGVLAIAACGLATAGCASQNAPAAASSPAPASASAPAGAPSAAAPSSGTPSAASPSAGSSAASGSCDAAQLKISLTHTGALAGQAGGYLEFTNAGSTPCRMSGWPAVDRADGRGPDHVAAAHAIEHVRRVALQFAGTDGEPAAGRLPPTRSWPPTTSPPEAAPAPRAVHTPAGEPAGRFGKRRPSPRGCPAPNSYLPACAAADGSPTAGTSTVTTLSDAAATDRAGPVEAGRAG